MHAPPAPLHALSTGPAPLAHAHARTTAHARAGMSDGKDELLLLAAATGLRLDPAVLELLVDLIQLGAQPKDILPYVRAVVARTRPSAPRPASAQ